MTETAFGALARGRGGARVVRSLRLVRRSRTLLMIRLIVDAAPSARPAFDVLAEAAEAAPDETGLVLDHPWVGAWATRTALALRRGTEASPRDLAFAAAAAALRCGVPARLDLPHADVLPLPSLGWARGTHGPVDVQGLDVVPLPEVRVADGVTFQLDRWVAGGVPQGVSVAKELDVPRWRDAVAAGWDVLASDQPEAAEEVAESVRVLTPLSASGSGTSSATAADALGCVFLSYSDDPEWVAMTLVHEGQHTKLAALMDLFTLTGPDRGERYYAPWREDPRPLVGLLHGTYAHLGIARFWRDRTSAHALAEYARWRAAAFESTGTLLSSGGLTSIGTEFVTGMADVLREWCAEPLPAEAWTDAAREAIAHRSRWEAAHTG